MLEFYLYLLMGHGLPATTYGYGEFFCGAVTPVPCETGAVTSSGETFDTKKATAAVFFPYRVKGGPLIIRIRTEDGPCIPVRVNDRGNERFTGKRNFDLSPKAVELLTGKPATPFFQEPIFLCDYEKIILDIQTLTKYSYFQDQLKEFP